MRNLGNWLQRVWYAGERRGALALVPLSYLYRGVMAIRRRWFRFAPQRSIGVPVIVVGNVTVGGTGKTPMVLWLVDRLKGAGWQPGIASRGYGGSAGRGPLAARADSDPAVVGDEPTLLARRARVPVMVGADRVLAASALVDIGVDVVVCDDGLQHLRLARDVEIAVVDGQRGLGNGRCLPAGPLREPATRLDTVDAVVVNGGVARRPGNLRMRLAPSGVLRVDGSDERRLEEFAGQTVNAVAGIGNPQRFFAQLREAGIDVIEHPLPDHAVIEPSDIDFGDGRAVLMTEKDAVKCAAFAGETAWYVRVNARFDDDDTARLEALLDERVCDARCPDGV